MSDAGKAVFLSYASQDAEAAKRIAEALRAAGVEVWFDQNELVGGDAWDNKIRKQIQSCALFVPIISANTQARAEGYFRLEWKLAVDRSHLMADDEPFLFPVVIDDTTDATARVPDKFRERQWMRLNVKDTPESLASRVAKLLSGEVGRDFQTPPGKAGFGDPALHRKEKSGFEKWWWLIFPIVGMAVPIISALKSRAPVERSAPAPAVSEVDQLVRQARELIYDPDSGRSDFALAESLLKRAIELAPGSGKAWGGSSLLNHYFFSRAYDLDQQRLVRAQADAEKALRLDPRNVDALLTLGLHRQRLGERAGAGEFLDRALAVDPQNVRVITARAGQTPDLRERARLLLEAAERADHPAELHYYAAVTLRFAGRYGEAARAADRAIAIRPFWRLFVARADYECLLTADPAKIDAWLDRVPELKRDEPRFAYMRYYAATLRRDGVGALRALRAVATDYFEDNFFIGPKAYPMARAAELAGDTRLAGEQWALAERTIRERLATEPGRIAWRPMLAVALHGLGRTGEARTLAEEVATDPRLAEAPFALETLAWAFARLGEPARALTVLQRISPSVDLLKEAEVVSAAVLPVDLRWDGLHGLPGWEDLLATLRQREGGESRTPSPATIARDWPKNPELKRVIDLVEGLESIPDDFALAEQIVKPILERAPADLEAVTVMARVQAQFMRRGFDRSDERSAQARLYGERALQLDPNEPEAMLAVATYLFSRVTGDARAERLLRRAMELDPGNPRPGRLLADLLNVQPGRQAEALTQSQENVRRFPNDVLSRYDLARLFKDQGHYEECDRELDATLALAPLPNAIAWKARLQFGLHNDLAGMKRWLDQVPERVRGTERSVFGYFLYASFGGDVEVGLEALRSFTQKWFTDFEYAGPTALLNASLLQRQGKAELARQQYEAALLEVQRMRATDPARIWLNYAEFWTLHGLGRKEEARLGFRRLVEAQRRPYAQSLVTGWWFTLIPGALLLGDRDTALEFLRESVATLPEGRAAIRVRMQLDPRMAPFRDDPEIVALLAGPSSSAKATEDREAGRK